ncbi:DNA ligase [Chloroflexia bacterium SDU3-3]|nr:DNA ligase [Chloroflexia bacterium SDU3-3]
MEPIYKYPRTQHLAGSGVQAGDEDLDVAPFRELAGRHLVVEEKMDGANAAISFDADGRVRLQSRGHYLTGGPRERQFALFKGWAQRYTADLWPLLGDRYVMYGEWLYGKHTTFYTDLPHYFMEFDILDTRERTFLSTPQRMRMLERAPFVASVAVLHQGALPSMAALTALLGPSLFIAADHRERLRAVAHTVGVDAEQVLRETDPTGLMEGLYVKVEDRGLVAARYKYVRSGFLQTVIDSGSHWMDRPLVPNQLRPGASLW